jgi:hypothetical protein
MGRKVYLANRGQIFLEGTEYVIDSSERNREIVSNSRVSDIRVATIIPIAQMDVSVNMDNHHAIRFEAVHSVYYYGEETVKEKERIGAYE